MVSMTGGSKVHTGLKVLATLTGAGVAVTTALGIASGGAGAKGFNLVTGGTQFQNQLAFISSRALGPSITAQILGQGRTSISVASLPPQGVTPFGVFNSATFGGIILAIADGVAKEFLGGTLGYSSYVSPFLKAIAGGLIVGGVFGGLFDAPAGPVRTGIASPLYGSSGGGGPSGYAHAGQLGLGA